MRALILLLCISVSLRAAELELQPGTMLVLPSAKEATVLLAKEDAYLKRMSPFDRAARIVRAEPPPVAEFAAYVGAQALDFSSAEIATVSESIKAFRSAFGALKLSLPPTITLAKTNGREDIDAPYCRGPLIVMPASHLGKPELGDILIHELFHVFSSHHPELRDQLYGLLGFLPCAEPLLPASVDARRFTNPDAMGMNYYTILRHEDRDIAMMPALLAQKPTFDMARKNSVFDQIEFVLLELTIVDGKAALVLKDGEPVMRPANAVPAFLRAMSRNTNYIWHPEEVLADNFVRALRPRRKLNAPELPGKLVEVMQTAATR